MSSGVGNAAIFFASDFINESKKGIKGRQSAHEGFLKGFARYAQLNEFVAFVPNAGRIENFKSFVQRHDPLNRPCRGLLWARPATLRGIGAVQFADPALTASAWTRRNVGDAAYSLAGVIHTLSSDGVMRLLRSYSASPLQEWDALICTSDAGRRVVEAAFEESESFVAQRFRTDNRPPRLQLPVIPLGVHVDDFAPTPTRRAAGAALRRELGIAADEVVFLFLGRLSFHAKAHPMAMMQAAELAAARTRTPVRLMFVGQFANQATAAEYQALANAICRRAKVVFVDGADAPRSQAAWSAADAFISLSDNIQETFGLTIIEAMAASLPVVASDWNGYRQSMVHGETGMMIPTLTPPPGMGAELAADYDVGLLTYDRFVGAASQSTAVDVGAAAAAMAALAEDPALRARLGQGAAARAQAFDWKALIPQYQALWAELAARRAVATAQEHPTRALSDPFTLFSDYATQLLSSSTWLRAGADASSLVKRALTFGMNRFAIGYMAPPEGLRRMAEIVARVGAITVGALGSAFPTLSEPALLRSVGWLIKVTAVEAASEAAFDPAAFKDSFDAGLAAFQSGDKHKAVAHFRQALWAQPTNDLAIRNLIVALKSIDALADAVLVARSWAARRPDLFTAWHELARALLASGELAEARTMFERALALHDGDSHAWNGYGLCLRRLTLPDLARGALERGLALAPNDVNILANLGNTYLDQHRADEALVHYRRILEVKPQAMEAYTNIGAAERRAGRIDAAAACYKAGLEVYPNDDSLRHNMAMAMLGSGHYSEGWDAYRARPSAGKARRVGDRWSAADVAGKRVLIEWEQGLGDEIFFLRFWAAAAALGADLYYRPNPKLKPLLARSPQFADRLVELNAKFTADVTVGVGDLPWLTGHVDGAAPPASIVLTPEPQLTEQIRGQLAAFGPPPYIGVAWRGGTADKGATLFKETPLARLAQLLQGVAGTVVMVQRRPTEAEVAAFQEALGRPALDCCAFNEDFEQIFALVAQLDELVGVSNTNVHLRAAVGKGSRVLVPNPPDFRWMQSGSPSPWFPQSHVYRQLTNGDWDGAYLALAQDLGSTQDPRRLVGADRLQAEAKAAYTAGDLAGCESLCRQALSATPNHQPSHFLLGAALLGLGQLEAALAEASQAVALAPKSGVAWNLLGSIHQGLDRKNDALNAFKRALQLDPERVEINANIGSVLGQLVQLEAAETAFKRAMEGAPQHPGVWSTYAAFQFGVKNFAAAEAAARRAAELEPHNPLHFQGMGQCQLEREDFHGAVESFQRCLALAPGMVAARRALITGLMWLGRLEEAEAAARQVLAEHPSDWRVIMVLADIAFRRHQAAEGCDLARRAATLVQSSADISDVANLLIGSNQMALAEQLITSYAPSSVAEKVLSLRNSAGLKAYQGDVTAAEAMYRQAADLDPEDLGTQEVLGLCLLAQGKFEEGWPHYLKRRSLKGMFQHLNRESLPQDLTGRRIMLGRDQGVGDELFFLRFAVELKRRGAWIGYVATPAILPLAQTLPYLDQVTTRGGELKGCDLKISLGDLPGLLNIASAAEIPPPIQLTPTPERVEAMRRRLAACGPGPYLALAWQAGAFNAKALYKMAPPELIADAARVWPGTCLSVQRRPLADSVAKIEALYGQTLHDFSDANGDLQDMLALMSVVDEMACVSNTNVHLRATIGKFSRVLVPIPPDFRWMWSGDYSPWYPDHPVYRQAVGGDWTEAGRRLRVDLRAAAGGVA